MTGEMLRNWLIVYLGNLVGASALLSRSFFPSPDIRRFIACRY
jgi:formate/nitrite transporter FocA (FNT family)